MLSPIITTTSPSLKKKSPALVASAARAGAAHRAARAMSGTASVRMGASSWEADGFTLPGGRPLDDLFLFRRLVTALLRLLALLLLLAQLLQPRQPLHRRVGRLRRRGRGCRLRRLVRL